MKSKNVKKIDFSRKRFSSQADKAYNEGKYLSALRLAYKEMEIYGEDGESYARLADIYEGMSLQGSAINWWFRYLDIAEEEELPDIYEGLAVNFLNSGSESQSAYYYNQLIDSDDTLPDEIKLDIAEAFSRSKKDNFRFVYPPRLTDYSKELESGTKALRSGNFSRAVFELDKIEKGSKQYVSAKETQAVAYLLAGNHEKAEEICNELIQEHPNNIRIRSTLAAVYFEQGHKEKSIELAKELFALEISDTDDLYKVATVCCENGLHDEAYQKFCLLTKKIPYDGRILYFKAVAAYNSGKVEESERVLETLCTIYPDAEVAKYFLNWIKRYKDGETENVPQLHYFYHLPQEERERRCQMLIHAGKCSKDEALIFEVLFQQEGFFRWCFDEMDGGDHDLQYLALITANHLQMDKFIYDVLLDADVIDVLKIEALRLLLERNTEQKVGIVLCNIYRKVLLAKIQIGRKKRKKFVDAYAKIASKFVAINDMYGKKIKEAAEKVYQRLETNDGLDLIENSDDCACVIFILSELKELGSDLEKIASAFEANYDKVKTILTIVDDKRIETHQNTEKEVES